MKKLLSIVLIFGLLFTAFPVTAFAKENVAETEIQTAKDNLVEVGEATQAANGTCGDNLKWSLDGNGTLSITGTGDMYFDNSAPWSNIKDSIKKVKIRNGVTSIGGCAFESCGSLTSITIPDSVTSIGKSAFWGCISLVDVTMGCGITNIESYAFQYCGLTNITIPEGVTSIGGSAFSYCSCLESITIPDSVTSIGRSAFGSCNKIRKVNVTDISAWCEIKFEDSDSNPLCYGADLYLNGSHVTDLKIPDSITSIGEYAFRGCTSITSITIPNGITSIERDAFRNCTNLTSITILKSVTSIGDYAFEGCENLKSIIMPKSVISVGEYAFWRCTSLSDIYYSGTMKMWYDISIGEYNYDLLYANIHFGTESPKTTITLPKANASLFIGDRANINAVITNGFGATTYRSSNTKVAKISSNGLVTAVGAGTAKITVTNNGVSKIFTVTVKKTTVSLARYSANVYVKGSTVIKPTVRNGRGKTAFKSLNTKVARVYSNGKVTAIKAGTAKIRVTNNKVSRIFTVKVLNPKLNKTSVAISRGKSFTLKITGRIGTAKFYTSNKRIATVNSKGKITVNKKAKKGKTAVITVKTNGVTLRCKVKVK